MIKICAIITSYNRKETTIECLHCLETAAKIAKINLTCVLVDDGSTDGTAEEIQENFNWVNVISGNSDLFWNRGMHIGFAEAMKQGVDAYLWVNDDTHLFDVAISKIINTWKDLEKKIGKPVVVAGATADKKNGTITYGGSVAKSKLKRFTFIKVWDELETVECHVANGNFLLIPHTIAHEVGNLDFAFEHALGDIDFTLRVRKAGFSVYVAPGVIGYCSHNSIKGTYRDYSLSFLSRFKAMLARKGLPPRSYLHFTMKHGGLIWPVYFVWPYIKFLLDSASHFFKRR